MPPPMEPLIVTTAALFGKIAYNYKQTKGGDFSKRAGTNKAFTHVSFWFGL